MCMKVEWVAKLPGWNRVKHGSLPAGRYRRSNGCERVHMSAERDSGQTRYAIGCAEKRIPPYHLPLNL